MAKPKVKKEKVPEEKSPWPNGLKIVSVRNISKKELDQEGWEDHHGTCAVLVLEDGSVLYPSRDDEGNGPGTLFGVDKKGEAIHLFVQEKVRTY